MVTVLKGSATANTSNIVKRGFSTIRDLTSDWTLGLYLWVMTACQQPAAWPRSVACCGGPDEVDDNTLNISIIPQI